MFQLVVLALVILSLFAMDKGMKKHTQKKFQAEYKIRREQHKKEMDCFNYKNLLWEEKIKKDDEEYEHSLIKGSKAWKLHQSWKAKQAKEPKDESSIRYEKQLAEFAKHRPPHEVMILQCPKLFYETYTIGPRETFFPAKLYNTYLENLRQDKCQKSETLLYNHYRKTYSNAPESPLTKSSSDRHKPWTSFIYKEAPEMESCYNKIHFQEAKTKIETAQKFIDDNNIKTVPITNLNTMELLETRSQTEETRNDELSKIIRLAMQDHSPAITMLIELSNQGHAYKLRPDTLFLLLSRLKHQDQLPDSLKTTYEQTRTELTKEEATKISRRASTPTGFFRQLINNMPTVLDKSKFLPY